MIRKSVWDATPEELITAGWGSHQRHTIPADWETRRGPDAGWGDERKRLNGKIGGRKRRSYAELCAERMRLYGQQRYGD